MPRYRFANTGALPLDLNQYGSAGMNPVCEVVNPPHTQDLIFGAEHLSGAVDFMKNQRGWTLVETDPPAPTARTVENIETVALVANSASFPVASGWTDVTGFSTTISTRGGSKLVVELLAATATILVGGSVRVLINGGTFSNVVVGAVNFPVLVGGSTGFRASVNIPAGARASHTVRVQAQGVGALASVSLAAVASCMTVTEYRA